MLDVTMDCFGLTDQGKVRRNNEDQFLIASLHKVMKIEHTSLPEDAQKRFESTAMARLLLVADGAGGHEAGEVASGLAIETVASYVTHSMKCFYQLDSPLESDLLSALESSVAKSHAIVQAEAEKSASERGMATTLTVVHILWPRAYLVQVGDSRCYRLRDGELSQLTKDQTLAQRLVDDGVLKPEKAKGSKFGNILVSAVGSDAKPVTSTVDLRGGDVLLLCSDGLTKHVSDDRIGEILETSETAEKACRALVAAALEGGGTDNVTAVVCRFD